MKRPIKISQILFVAVLLIAIALTVAFAWLSAPFFQAGLSGCDGVLTVERDRQFTRAGNGAFAVARSTNFLAPADVGSFAGAGSSQTQPVKLKTNQNILREREGSTFTSGFV